MIEIESVKSACVLEIETFGYEKYCNMVSVVVLPSPLKLSILDPINSFNSSVCQESYLPFEEVWKGKNFSLTWVIGLIKT